MDERVIECRACGDPLTTEVVDLGHTPLANAYLTAGQLREPETTHPLRVMVCDNCTLAQLDHTAAPAEVFSDYDYFSSTSPTWAENARLLAGRLTERFHLDEHSRVLEIGSNDGYLLKHFLPHGVEVLGVDPAANCAREAERCGVETLADFFGRRVAHHLFDAGRQADIITGTNVFAHVPDIHDLLGGVFTALKAAGVVTLEFPHVKNLLEQNQFDTIYHEHYFYYSLHAVKWLFDHHGMEVFDVEELPTHGGSLRIYAQKNRTGTHFVNPRVMGLMRREKGAGLDSTEGYEGLAPKVREVKLALRDFLVSAAGEGKTVAAYGAPAKGMTLLNVCGVDRDLIKFVVDDSPHKQGKFTPGTHIPIVPRERLLKEQPAYTVILPWNLADPIRESNRYYLGEWVLPIPEVQIL